MLNIRNAAGKIQWTGHIGIDHPWFDTIEGFKVEADGHELKRCEDILKIDRLIRRCIIFSGDEAALIIAEWNQFNQTNNTGVMVETADGRRFPIAGVMPQKPVYGIPEAAIQAVNARLREVALINIPECVQKLPNLIPIILEAAAPFIISDHIDNHLKKFDLEQFTHEFIAKKWENRTVGKSELNELQKDLEETLLKFGFSKAIEVLFPCFFKEEVKS